MVIRAVGEILVLTLSLVQGCFALCLVIAPFGCILASTASTESVIKYGVWGWCCGRQKSWSHSPVDVRIGATEATELRAARVLQAGNAVWCPSLRG